LPNLLGGTTWKFLGEAKDHWTLDTEMHLSLCTYVHAYVKESYITAGLVNLLHLSHIALISPFAEQCSSDA
jgi:hypothetical protein